MTDAVTEMPTTRLRWHWNGRTTVLQQLWHIQTCEADARWVLKEEWRDVPNEKN